MSYALRIQSRAHTEIIDAYQWYENQVPNLG
jgi:hypothetical protein